MNGVTTSAADSDTVVFLPSTAATTPTTAGGGLTSSAAAAAVHQTMFDAPRPVITTTASQRHPQRQRQRSANVGALAAAQGRDAAAAGFVTTVTADGVQLMGPILRRKKVVSMPLGMGGDFFMTDAEVGGPRRQQLTTYDENGKAIIMDNAHANRQRQLSSTSIGSAGGGHNANRQRQLSSTSIGSNGGGMGTVGGAVKSARQLPHQRSVTPPAFTAVGAMETSAAQAQRAQARGQHERKKQSSLMNGIMRRKQISLDLLGPNDFFAASVQPQDSSCVPEEAFFAPPATVTEGVPTDIFKEDEDGGIGVEQSAADKDQEAAAAAVATEVVSPDDNEAVLSEHATAARQLFLPLRFAPRVMIGASRGGGHGHGGALAPVEEASAAPMMMDDEVVEALKHFSTTSEAFLSQLKTLEPSIQQSNHSQSLMETHAQLRREQEFLLSKLGAGHQDKPSVIVEDDDDEESDEYAAAVKQMESRRGEDGDSEEVDVDGTKVKTGIDQGDEKAPMDDDEDDEEEDDSIIRATRGDYIKSSILALIMLAFTILVCTWHTKLDKDSYIFLPVGLACVTPCNSFPTSSSDSAVVAENTTAAATDTNATERYLFGSSGRQLESTSHATDSAAAFTDGNVDFFKGHNTFKKNQVIFLVMNIDGIGGEEEESGGHRLLEGTTTSTETDEAVAGGDERNTEDLIRDEGEILINVGEYGAEGPPVYAMVQIIGMETGQVKAVKHIGPAEAARSSYEELIKVDFAHPEEPHIITVTATTIDGQAQPKALSFTLYAKLRTPLANYSVLIAALIMIFVYVFILIEVIHRTLVSIFGSMIALFFWFVINGGETEAISQIMLHMEWSTLGLLFGMMLIVGELSHTGIFEWCAVRLLVASKGSFNRLFILLCLLTSIASAFLDNVTTMLLVAPVTIDMCNILDVDPRPYLIGEVLLSNVGGTATLIGDPPNIIIGSSFDAIGFVDFIIHVFPAIFLFCVPATLCLGLWIYRWYFTFSKMRVLDTKILKKTYPVYDEPRLLIAGTVTFFVILTFFLHSVHHKDTAWIALFGAFMTIAFTNPHDVQDALRNHVEWDTLLFFAGLFVLVEVCAAMGLLAAIGNTLASLIESQPEEKQLSVAITLVLWVSAIVSAFLDNIPYTATMIPVINILAQSLPDTLPLTTLAWALSFGACLGGNGTLLGASANIVTAGIAKNKGFDISFMNFFYPGMLTTFVTVAIANIYMLVRYSWV